MHNVHMERAAVDYLTAYQDYFTERVQDLNLICHHV